MVRKLPKISTQLNKDVSAETDTNFIGKPSTTQRIKSYSAPNISENDNAEVLKETSIEIMPGKSSDEIVDSHSNMNKENTKYKLPRMRLKNRDKNEEPVFTLVKLSKKFNLQYLALLIVTVLTVVGIGFSTAPIVTSFPSSPASAKDPQVESRHGLDLVAIKSGDTLYKLLAAYNASMNEVRQILAAAKAEGWDASNLKTGTFLQIKYSSDGLSGDKTLTGLSFNLSHANKIEIEKKLNAFTAISLKTNFRKSLVKISGVINSSIMSSALKAGVPLKNLSELVKLYSHQIDFQRDIRNGDKFTVLMEKFIADGGKDQYFGNIVFSSLDLRGNKHSIYRFKLADNTEDFFDEHGRSVKRSLLRSPVTATRISSGFGIRVHPISGYTHMHQGVDFAASLGAPIYSAGNGIVTQIGFHGAYGRYIEIKHTSELSTAYAHAKSFASGLAKGSKVKQGQVIAYVGSSGSATGAHLHYEVIMNGVKINPLKVKTLPIKKLTGAEKERFLRYKADMKATSSLSDGSNLIASLKNYVS